MKVMASGLIVPESTDHRPPVFFCAVPGCQAAFHEGERTVFERHVIGCSERNADRIHEASARTQMPGIFGDEGWDVEEERWVREHGQEILEGRKRM